MPKNNGNDPITDQEIAFAHLLLLGSMTDQRAAEVAGLNPATAAYTRSKPCVRAYMLEHRAAKQKQSVEQETESLHRLNPDREQVLARLWDIANLAPETTRGNLASQVKALAMIVAIQDLIPSRRPTRREEVENQPAPPHAKPDIYKAAWLRKQQAETNAGAPDPSPSDPLPGVETASDLSDAEPAQNKATGASDSNSPEAAVPSRPGRPASQWVPDAVGEYDTREPFSIKRNGFSRRR